MMRFLLTLAVALMVPFAAQAGDVDHSKFDALLKANVKGDTVNYAGFVGNKDFEAYVKTLMATDVEKLPTREAKLAFWINTYNAMTIHGVLKHWPSITSVASVYPDFDFFKRTDYTIGGKALSLNNIENDIIRPQFKEPRIHAAVNCASVSCPPLMNFAFTADKLEAQLEQAFTAFANDTKRNSIDPATGAVKLSKIFEWYKVDFEPAGGPAKYIAKFIKDEAKKKALLEAKSIGHLEYDWNLNKAK